MPGEATLLLPLGRVRLTSQEESVSTGEGGGFRAPAELVVSVSPVNGGAGLELQGESRRVQIDFGTARVRLGFVAVPASDHYVVRAGPGLEGRDGAKGPRRAVAVSVSPASAPRGVRGRLGTVREPAGVKGVERNE